MRCGALHSPTGSQLDPLLWQALLCSGRLPDRQTPFRCGQQKQQGYDILYKSRQDSHSEWQAALHEASRWSMFASAGLWQKSARNKTWNPSRVRGGGEEKKCDGINNGWLHKDGEDELISASSNFLHSWGAAGPSRKTWSTPINRDRSATTQTGFRLRGSDLLQQRRDERDLIVFCTIIIHLIH